MRILYITYFFPPEIGAASVRAGDMVKILLDMGNEVDVLTSLPHYPYGKVYSDYKDTFFNAKVHIVNSQLSSNSDSTLKRLKAQYDFFKKAKSFNAEGYDVVISTTPPLFASWLGHIFSKRHKIYHVLDVRDLWPESVVETGMISKYNPMVLYAYHISKKIIKNANLIISPVKGILKRYPNKKTIFIPNSLQPLKEPKLNHNSKLKCIYAGTIGHMQNVGLLNSLKGDNFEISVIGAGKNVEKLKDVNYLGPMSREDTVDHINNSDVGLVLMKHNKDFFKDALPSKIFEYITYGKPIISNLFGETADFLRQNNCGITINGTQKSLKAAIEFLATHPKFYEKLSKNALLASKKYSKINGVKKLIDTIKSELK